MTKDKSRPPAGKPQIGRNQTDESLRRERNITDHTVAADRKLSQDRADDIVEDAREQADEVLDAARDKADQKLGPHGSRSKAAQETVNRERAMEDVALDQERASADDILRREREEQSRILATLLPFEREKTDRYLLSERELSDDAVIHRDDFMGMVSHELRNLLAGIAIHTNLLSKRASDTDEGRRTRAGMESIERCVARMNRLIGDLFDVASIDAGKLAVHPEPGDVAQMISEAITPFAHTAEQKGLSLEFSTGAQKFMGDFDWERMLQVVANLVANAMRFTPSGGKITIKIEPMGSDLRVTVLDTGEGIRPELREAIFERFGQANPKDDHRGLGLGLYISNCIVEAQGGRIWAEANPAGTGSAFHFTIPASGGAGPLIAKVAG